MTMEVSTSPAWLKEPIRDPEETACVDPDKDIIMFSEVTRPVTFSMKLFGLWHDRSPTGVVIHPSDQVNGVQPGKTISVWNVLNRLAIFYHIFITLLLWFDFFRFFVIIAPMITFQKMSYVCWFLQTAATNAVLFLACYRSCKIQKFYLFWQNSSAAEKHRADFNPRQADKPSLKPACSLQRKKFQKVGILAALGGWFFVLGSYPISLYFTFGYEGHGFGRLMCWPWTNDIVCGFLQVIHFFALASHKFPIIYICLLCYILSERFDAVTKSFEKHNPMGTLANSEVLEATRRQHNILCLLTAQCDYIFSTVIAIAFATNIPLLIFLMYDLYVNGSTSSSFGIAASCYWSISNFFNILLLSWFCSLLNEKAHSLRRHVFELHVDSSDTKTSHVHLLLVSRLNGPNIGLSFIGFFTITRNVILTIAGFVLTYFTLLIDLSPGTDSEKACPNVTSEVTS